MPMVQFSGTIQVLLPQRPSTKERSEMENREHDNFRNLGTTPILKKNALGVKRPFSEQLSEFRGILGAILGMALTT